jgi:hypothetical protein
MNPLHHGEVKLTEDKENIMLLPVADVKRQEASDATQARERKNGATCQDACFRASQTLRVMHSTHRTLETVTGL